MPTPDPPLSGISDEILTGAPERAPMDLVERQALAAFEQRLFGVVNRVEVGRYELLDKIGAGGSGLVFSALDPKLHRKVAIKFVHRSSDAEASIRLVREARALAGLTHPNVVRVYDVGTVDDAGHEGGTVYVVMELLEGESLQRWLEQGRSWRAIIEVFVAAGRGLAAAHGRDLVHRDFKPGNVHVGRVGRDRGHVGRDREVRVLDFGFARSSRPLSLSGLDSKDSLDPASRLTADGAVVGTLRYMAPEQRAGQRELDARADQYSFCLSLTEALSGAASPEGLTQLSAWIPGTVVRALRRGLSEDPGARWPSMEPLLDELVRAERTRARVLGGGGVGLVAALGLALAFASSRPGASGDASSRSSSSACTSSSPSFSAIWGEAARAGLNEALRTEELPYTDASAATAMATFDAYARRGDELSVQLCDAGEGPSACLGRAHDSLAVTLEVLTSPGGGRVEAAASLARDLPELDSCVSEGVASRHELGAEDHRRLVRVRAWRRVGELDLAEQLGATQLAELGPELGELRALASLEHGLTLLEGDRFELAERVLEDAYFGALERSDDPLALAATIALIRAGARAGKDTTRWRREGQVWLSRTAFDAGEETKLRVDYGRALLEAREPEAAREVLVAALAQVDALEHTPTGVHGELVMGLILAEFDGAPPVAGLSAHAHRVLAARETALGPRHPASLRAGLGLGLLLAARGEPGALERLEEVAIRSEGVLDADDALLARARARLDCLSIPVPACSAASVPRLGTQR